MRHKLAVVSLALAAIPALFADVTLRYKSEVKLNPALPNIMQGMMAFDTALPPETVSQFKNGKGFTSHGSMTSICDFTKQEITLLDKNGKRYATVSWGKFGDVISAAMPQMPEQAKAMMASMKSHIDSRVTGQSATIQGIEAEEREIVMTMDPPAAPNMPAMSGPMMRFVMHFWTAKASEVMRVPAIREIASYNIFAAATMNPLGDLQKMFQQMPMVNDVVAVMKDIQSGGTPVVLRIQMQMYMPFIGAMMKQMPAGQSPFGANFNPDEPFAQMNQEAVEISTASIPDSVFEVPEGYQQVSADEIFKDLIYTHPQPFASGVAGGVPGGVAGAPGGTLPGAVPPPPPPPTRPTPQRIRVAGNVQQANLIRKIQPVYPPLAKQANVQGSVHFTAIIGKDGTIQNLQLIGGHPLLVQAAQEAAKQWQYKPTLLNGEPVEVVTQIDVDFTLSQ